jgi:drug/metabolite transporter (DMT)-like permease
MAVQVAMGRPGAETPVGLIQTKPGLISTFPGHFQGSFRRILTPLTTRTLLLILLQATIFGFSIIATRSSLNYFDPIVFSGLRMALASLIYAAVYFFTKRTWPRDLRLWKHAFIFGIFWTSAPMLAIILSLQYQSSGVTSMLLTINPILTVLIAHFFLKNEALDRRKMIGVLIALGGAVILLISGESGLADVVKFNPLGYALVTLAMISTASTAVYGGKNLPDVDPFDVAAAGMLISTLIVLPVAAFIGIDFRGLNREAYLILAYASVGGTFGGPLLAFYMIKYFGATVSSMVTYVIPVVTVIGGVLLLDERITPVMLVAMVLIIFGISRVSGRVSD